MSAGRLDEHNRYPEGTVNGKVQLKLTEMAEKRAIDWSFNVRRGRVATEILSLATSTDLIVMGRMGRSMTGDRLDSTASRLIEHGRGMALLLNEGLRLYTSVIMLLKGSILSKRAVEMAGLVVWAAGGAMGVLIPAPNEAEFKTLRDAAPDRQ
jgi:hypothetical protein